MRRAIVVLLSVALVTACGATSVPAATRAKARTPAAAPRPKPSETPARDLVASALTDISRCRVLDPAAVQAAWDRMAQGLALLLSQSGKWTEPESQLRGDVEWLLREGAARAKMFGRIDDITAEIVRPRGPSGHPEGGPQGHPKGGEASALIVQPIIAGTLRPECLMGNSTQLLLWRAGNKTLYQAFVYGLDRPADWSAPFKRDITQLTVWRWPATQTAGENGAMVLGMGSAVERGTAIHPEFLVLRQEKGGWTVRQRMTSDAQGYPAWTADVDGDKIDEVILRTTTWPDSEPFNECQSCPHVYYDSILHLEGEAFGNPRRVRVASPYAALCDFTLALRRGDRAEAARLAAADEVLEEATAAHLDTARELRALSALASSIEFSADGAGFAAQMVPFGDQWKVAGIEPKRPASRQGAGGAP